MSATKPKVHFRSIRHTVNAGMDFPACYGNARLLDLDKSRLPTTTDRNAVTCERCQRIAYLIPNAHKATADEIRQFARIARRADLIEFACRVDRNGCFTDEQATLEFGRPHTIAMLRDIVRSFAEDK